METDPRENRFYTLFNGYLNLDALLTSRLSLSLQVEYSLDQVDYDDTDLSDDFFTGTTFEDDELELEESRALSALLRLEYRLGAADRQYVLGGSALDGAGRVRGSVYADSNGDGVRQANEQGIAGITVFLDSVHPVVTNAAGEFLFPRVAPGNHFILVEEAELPLPWSLLNGEFTSFAVNLRRSTEVNIPVGVILDGGEMAASDPDPFGQSTPDDTNEQSADAVYCESVYPCRQFQLPR